MSNPIINLSTFISMVHDRLQGGNAVEETASALLAENQTWSNLKLDAPLNGDDEVEDRIFRVLTSSPEMTSLGIASSMEASSAEEFLRSAIPAMPNLDYIIFGDNPMTASEAERIITILKMNTKVRTISISFGHTDDGLARVFSKYLRETSSTNTLNLSLSREGVDGPTSSSEAALNSICNGISESSSLQMLGVVCLRVEDADMERNAMALAGAVASSSSLERIGIISRELSRTLAFADHICSALLQTEPVQNFDLCFRKCADSRIELSRTFCWKSLMPQNIPLGLWPRILAKANTWNQQTSHSSLDALYFLTKEKCDVLLQNVRRRPIRKRKRSAYDS